MGCFCNLYIPVRGLVVNVISWLVTALRPTRVLSALNLFVDGSNSSSELAIARLAVTELHTFFHGKT